MDSIQPPLAALDALVASAHELVDTSRVSTRDDFKRLLEGAEALRTRITALDAAYAPRGDDVFIHHLRSPLNLVAAYASVILDEADSALTDRHIALLRQIEHDAEQVSAFIADCCE